MKRYLLFCTAAVALACVSCLARISDESATNLKEESASAPLGPSGHDSTTMSAQETQPQWLAAVDD